MIYYAALTIIGLSFLILINYVIFTLVFRNAPEIKCGDISKYPKVSILKPFRNIEDAIEQNLDTFYAIDYPDFEMVLGVDALGGECIPVLEKIKQKYPNVRTKIISASSENVMNPKIEILSKLAKISAGELYWISDSNTRVEKNTLKNLVHEYVAKGSKIVFSPIRGTGSRTIGSVLENAYMNFFTSGNIIAAWKYFGRKIIVGKSMLVEKIALERFGGFEHFREYLGEDYMMGEIYSENDVPVSTNLTWIINYNSFATIKSFCSRISRWSKLRFHIDRFFYVLEILTNPIAISLLFLPFLGQEGLTLLWAVSLAKIVIEYVNFFSVNNYDRRKLWIAAIYPFCIVLKDLLLFIIYLIPFVSETVNWRGRKIRIGAKSRIYSFEKEVDVGRH